MFACKPAGIGLLIVATIFWTEVCISRMYPKFFFYFVDREIKKTKKQTKKKKQKNKKKKKTNKKKKKKKNKKKNETEKTKTKNKKRKTEKQ